MSVLSSNNAENIRPFDPVLKPERNGILFGPFGLRAGWSILLFFFSTALLSSAIIFSLIRVSSTFHTNWDKMQAGQRAAKAQRPSSRRIEPQPVRVEMQLPLQAGQALTLLLVVAGLARLERRRFGVFGLGRPRPRDLVGGALTGLLALSLLAGVLRSLHLLIFDGRLLYGVAALRSGLLWLLLFALVGFFEEFFFRGYLQYTLTRGLLGLGKRLSPKRPQRAAFSLAAVSWSALFVLSHLGNPGERLSGLAAVFVAGLVFSYALWRTRSLWWSIGFHMTWDWSESFLYGVPDSGILSAGRLFSTHATGNPLLSGGSAGPEGSLLVIPVLLLTVVVLQAWPRTPPPLDFEQDAAPS